MSQSYRYQLGSKTYQFADLAELMAKATPARSGDRLAGVIAESAEQRAVAQLLLAEVPLKTFLNETLVPYEDDEITRLIIDEHDAEAFSVISHLTVGDFRNWLLTDTASTDCTLITRPMMSMASRPVCWMVFYMVLGMQLLVLTRQPIM
mgnify:CR=1 FL=1